MAFNIAEFSANLDDSGILQTNKFDTLFFAPYTVQAAYPDFDYSLINLRAEQIKFPGSILETNEVHTYGVGVSKRFPTNTRFTENSITFLDDRNNSLLKFFYVWMNTIFDTVGYSGPNGQPSYRTEYRNNYITDIYLNTYDQEGYNPTQAVMTEAFPTAINDVQLDWSQENMPFRVTVTFAFTQWYISNFSTYSSFVGNVSNSLSSLPTFTESSGVLEQSLGSLTNNPVVQSLSSSAAGLAQKGLNALRSIPGAAPAPTTSI